MVRPSEVTDEAGLEHPADYPGKARLSTASDAKSDALSAVSPTLAESDLARIVAVWPTLAADLRARLLNLVDRSVFTR